MEEKEWENPESLKTLLRCFTQLESSLDFWLFKTINFPYYLSHCP